MSALIFNTETGREALYQVSRSHSEEIKHAANTFITNTTKHNNNFQKYFSSLQSKKSENTYFDNRDITIHLKRIRKEVMNDLDSFIMTFFTINDGQNMPEVKNYLENKLTTRHYQAQNHGSPRKSFLAATDTGLVYVCDTQRLVKVMQKIATGRFSSIEVKTRNFNQKLARKKTALLERRVILNSNLQQEATRSVPPLSPTLQRDAIALFKNVSLLPTTIEFKEAYRTYKKIFKLNEKKIRDRDLNKISFKPTVFQKLPIDHTQLNLLLMSRGLVQMIKAKELEFVLPGSQAHLSEIYAEIEAIDEKIELLDKQTRLTH